MPPSDQPVEVDQDDATVQGDNSSPSNQVKVADVFTKDPNRRKHTVIYTVALKVNKTQKSSVEFRRVVKEFIHEVNNCDSQAILHDTSNTKKARTFHTKEYNNLPERLSHIKKFFANANPLSKSGLVWTTVKIGFDTDPEELLDDMKDWADGSDHIVRVKPLQNDDTVRKIWFCLSHRNVDLETLSTAICRQYKFDLNETLSLSLKFSTIKDNNSGFYANRKRESENAYGSKRFIRGIITETTRNHYPDFYSWAMKVYSRSSTKFPLGIRLRALPIISKDYDRDTNEKIQALMQRQEWFLDCITQSYYMSVQNIDRIMQATQKTLRHLLMEIPISASNLTPLFISIGKSLTGEHRGYYCFSYPKLYEKKASRIVSNLNTFCFKTYGMDVVKKYFTPGAAKMATQATWDSAEGRAISSEEKELRAAVNEIDELEWFNKSEPQPTKAPGQEVTEEAPLETVETERNDEDTVSTFGNSLINGQSSKPIPKPTTSFSPVCTATATDLAQDDTRTVASLHTQVTTQADKINRLENLLKEIYGKNDPNQKQIHAYFLSVNKDSAPITAVTGAVSDDTAPGH